MGNDPLTITELTLAYVAGTDEAPVAIVMCSFSIMLFSRGKITFTTTVVGCHLSRSVIGQAYIHKLFGMQTGGYQ